MDRGEDGLPIINAGFIGAPAATPPRTPENFVCLRGPCRYYWRLVTMANEGNPAETWKALGRDPPRQHHHVCLLDPSGETDFTDGDNAYDCNKWDPMTVNEVVELRHRREQYEQQKRTEDKTDAEQR